MKKTASFIFAIFMALTLSASVNIVLSTWYMVSDSCKKCRMSDEEYYCGKCKDDTMYRAKSETFKRNGKFVTRHLMKCKECEHSSVWEEQ